MDAVTCLKELVLYLVFFQLVACIDRPRPKSIAHTSIKLFHTSSGSKNGDRQRVRFVRPATVTVILRGLPTRPVRTSGSRSQKTPANVSPLLPFPTHRTTNTGNLVSHSAAGFHYRRRRIREARRRADRRTVALVTRMWYLNASMNCNSLIQSQRLHIGNWEGVRVSWGSLIAGSTKIKRFLLSAWRCWRRLYTARSCGSRPIGAIQYDMTRPDLTSFQTSRIWCP
jgi:hypothetical protein